MNASATATPERMSLLAQGARELGLALTPAQLDQFELYYRELEAWNQRMNLTAITGYEAVQTRHFLDSLTAIIAFPQGLPPDAAVIDVGSGAGLPGLPLKLIWPRIRLTLLDSVGKKTNFIRHMADLLGLSGVTVLTGRAEEVARDPAHRQTYDLALARGLAKLPALLEYTLPLVRPGGHVLAWKHGGIEDELKSASRALRLLGGRLAGIRPVIVTGLTDNRILVIAEKTQPTPDQYPRRSGVPGKQPL